MRLPSTARANGRPLYAPSAPGDASVSMKLSSNRNRNRRAGAVPPGTHPTIKGHVPRLDQCCLAALVRCSFTNTLVWLCAPREWLLPAARLHGLHAANHMRAIQTNPEEDFDAECRIKTVYPAKSPGGIAASEPADRNGGDSSAICTGAGSPCPHQMA